MAWLTIENRHTGETLHLRRVREADGSVRLLIHGSLPVGSDGPPLHVHTRENERGIVTSGVLGAVVDGRQVTRGVGEKAEFPMGSWHRWWNEGSEQLTFEGEVIPVVDLDRYLQAMFAVTNAGPPDRPPLFYAAHAFRRHRHNQRAAVVPGMVQMLLLPLIVGIGHLLGKYRGTGWPGCPTDCSGAPTVEREQIQGDSG